MSPSAQQFDYPIINTFTHIQQKNDIPIEESTIFYSQTSSFLTEVEISSNFQNVTITEQISLEDYYLLRQSEPWTANFLDNLKTIDNPKILLPYYKNIRSLMLKDDFQAFNILLNSIRISDTSEVLMIGLLRLTNPWKSQISSWKSFLNRANIELDKRGHISEKLLYGLL